MPLDSPAKLEYPLHWAVFADEKNDLKELLANKGTLEIDKLDPRGKTPLMLAVVMKRFECARLLLEAGADASIPSREMWSVSNEAAAQGNEDFVNKVIHHRDYQKATRGARAMKTILEKLRDVPDFFCEMNWDFSSWVPFLTQVCPSDCHKIYKKGSSVRIDTTLVSFEDTNWVRGNQSFMFRLNNEGFVEFVTLDHDEKVAAVQELRDDHPLTYFDPREGAIMDRLTSPISTTYVDVDNIGFERTSRGFLSWFTSSDSTESFQGYDCKVLNASNVHLVTKRRLDHLSEQMRAELASLDKGIETKAIAGLKRFLAMNTSDENTTRDLLQEGLTADQYLDPNYKFEPGCDIGKLRVIERKSSAFKATLWMADDYPLNLNDQIIPIVELMAVNSAHFARLHKFIRLQLPAGFPIKIEIPLFHIVSARIGFQNVNVAGKHVIPLEDQNVHIEDEAFAIPPGYVAEGDGRYGITWNDDGDRNERRDGRAAATSYSEDMLLQYAIQQSILESNNSTAQDLNEERLVQMLSAAAPVESVEPPTDTAYFRAIRDSQMEDERRRREEELFEEEMRKVLELSKTEQ